MADYQQIVDEIRNLLAVDDQVLNDQMRELAADYAAACRDVNKRLRRCGEHLKQQLWCEAVHLAEMDPKLIDAVAVLDFAEREAFLELARIYDLPQAPPLMIDVADELQEAYPRYAALEKPLAVLRVMNLKHASARRRLSAMRELQRRDAGVPFWEEDIRLFEQHSFEDIEKQAQRDARRLDVQALDSRLAELSASDWSERPPARLVKRIESLRSAVVGRTASSQLPRLTDELVRHFDTYAAHFAENGPVALMNEPAWQATVQLYEQWYALAEQAGLLENDPQFQKAAPALAEIHRIQEEQARDRGRRDALAELEEAVVRPGVKRSQLRGLHRTAAQWALIPADVEEKYQRRLKKLWWNENWEKVLGVVLFLILVGAFVVFIVLVKN